MSSASTVGGSQPQPGGLESLPEFLTTSWRLNWAQDSLAKAQLKDSDWTVTTLTQAYLKAQLNTHLRQLDEQKADHVTPSLVSISAGKIIELLKESDNLDADLQTVTKSLGPTIIRAILRDVRTPYTLLRAFMETEQGRPSQSDPGTVGKTFDALQDIDQVVLLNERYIRSRSSASNPDNRYLVTLEHLAKILGKAPADTETTILVKREDPPVGGFEMLDAKRQSTLRILADSNTFRETFDRTTKGILKGLDWNGVFVAGGIVINTLLHKPIDEVHGHQAQESDIDIYLYGLTVKQANEKLEHIYDTWNTNLPADNSQKLVIKSAKTITFLADYPNRRIQVVLKLLPSPTHILLNFDLDACAIGFDGTQVLMLPRCARAIETGYSIFTMDLVYGHYLGARRATRESRVFKYADRGFGLRILPSYVQMLEGPATANPLPKSTQASDGTSDQAINTDPDSAMVGVSNSNADDGLGDSETPYWPFDTVYKSLVGYRKPNGDEPPLKTLKRIAYLGQDFTDRFYFGSTPLALEVGVESQGGRGVEWSEDYEERKANWAAYQEANDRKRTAGEPLSGPLMILAELDTSKRHRGLPNGRSGLGQFELFMRHCEAWRLDARADAELDRSAFTDAIYDDSTLYDDSPQYEWDIDFNADRITHDINSDNNQLFEYLKRAISAKLGLGYQHVGYNGYLTRRIRRQVCGPDLATVMRKQNTIPLLIPYELENYLLNELPSSYPDLPASYTAKPILIPVHDPAKHAPNATLPSLADVPGEAGNLRYWVITNTNMWACQHRVMDEVFEVLWSLFHQFTESIKINNSATIAGHHATWYMAKSFRILPKVSTPNTKSSTTASWNSKGLIAGNVDLREAALFRAWVFSVPSYVSREFTVDYSEREIVFDEEAYMYPVPDELFWRDEDVEMD
ncbi:MAG: hypothetical protein Q9187_004301 [Circinaria calcarea]